MKEDLDSISYFPINLCCNFAHSGMFQLQGENSCCRSKDNLPFNARGNPKCTDFNSNVLFVLSFMSSGDGGTEAQRAMGLLGLPHAQSMERDVFGMVENGISDALETILEQRLSESLKKKRRFLRQCKRIQSLTTKLGRNRWMGRKS